MTARQDQIKAAIGAHGMWKLRLQQAITSGKSEFAVAVVRTDNQCAFGKWLYMDITLADKRSPHYEEVRKLHATFHSEAAKVLGEALAGRNEQALKAMGHGSNFAHVSAELTKAMMKWLQEQA